MDRVLFALGFAGWIVYSIGTLVFFNLGYEDETEIHFYLNVLVGGALTFALLAYIWWEDHCWWKRYYAEREAEKAAEEAARQEENSEL